MVECPDCTRTCPKIHSPQTPMAGFKPAAAFQSCRRRLVSRSIVPRRSTPRENTILVMFKTARLIVAGPKRGRERWSALCGRYGFASSEVISNSGKVLVSVFSAKLKQRVRQSGKAAKDRLTQAMITDFVNLSSRNLIGIHPFAKPRRPCGTLHTSQNAQRMPTSFQT